MRVTICELPHEPSALDEAWVTLREHTARHVSELVLLPECAFVEPLWESERFDGARWAAAEARCSAWLARLSELGVDHIVGTRPVTRSGRRLNEGFCWSATSGAAPLRSKHYLPDEPGGWEARWFDRGERDFPVCRAGTLTFGLNICTELWALESYAGYAEAQVQMVCAPRATEGATTGKWLAAGVVAAVRSGAFCLSSNRVDAAGGCGGIGWIIGPDGRVLATTSANAPCATVDIDLAATVAAQHRHPCNVFREAAGRSGGAGRAMVSGDSPGRAP